MIKKIIIFIIFLIVILVVGLIGMYFYISQNNIEENKNENIEKIELNQIYYTGSENAYEIYDSNNNYIRTVRTIEEVEFYSNNPDFDVNSEPVDTDENEFITENLEIE